MGFPPRAWIAHEFMGIGAMAILQGSVLSADPTYVDDFWQVPGYLGANPPASLRSARIQHRTRIRKLIAPEEAKALGLPMWRFVCTSTPLRGDHLAEDVNAFRFEALQVRELAARIRL